MMNQFLAAALVAGAMFLGGCNNDNGSHHNYTPQPQPQPIQPVQPIQPTPIQPAPAPEQGIPDVGTGSVNYQPSCNSGFAVVTYIFRTSSTIDTNSFIITHNVDGQTQDIITGSVNTNGAISTMKEQVYISANTTDLQKAHQVRVDFVSDNVNQVNSFSFIQPSCAVEPTPDPEPDPVEPTPPHNEIPFYRASTGYNIGDYVRVDRGSVISTYRCVNDYISGAGGGWTTFRTELVNWRWVEDALPSMAISIK
jgi:PBP1b-binding outer membrane lipoprotein LpoB